MPTAVWTILRGLLVAASFVGLCAALRARFGLDRLVAPAVAAALIVVALMVAGMLNLLRAGAIALYALGIAGLLYAYVAKKSAPSPALLLSFALFLAYLLLRFRACRILQHDDFSHWALAARHLLEFDRFPGAADAIITNQSYPLGTACFIYYFARPLGGGEGIWLAAHYFLSGVMLLPLFSLIENRTAALYPAVVALCALFFGYACATASLKLDDLLAFSGAGTIAAILRHREDRGRALLASIPLLIAVAWFKSSGPFFSLCAALLLVQLSRKRAWLPRRASWSLLAIPIAAYLAWTLFLRLHNSAALHSTHAVSPLSYARNLYHLGLGGALRVAWGMLGRFFSLNKRRCVALATMALSLLALRFAGRGLSPEVRRHCRGACAAALGAYLLWLVLLYFTYLFSMTRDEALRLATYSRYDATGYTYAALLFAIAALCALGRAELTPGRTTGMRAVSLLTAAAVLALALLPNDLTRLSALYDPQNISNEHAAENARLRSGFQALREAGELPGEGRFLCYFNGNYGLSNVYVLSKYELRTDQIYIVHNSASAPERYKAGLRWGVSPVEDIRAALAQAAAQADAVLLLDESPGFEALLGEVLEESGRSLKILRWKA